VRQVVGLGAAAGQVKSRQSDLAGRKARRVWPWGEWMGGSAEGCPFDLAQGKRAERPALRGFRRAGGWVGLVGHAEWPARSRSSDRVQTSSDRPGPVERIRCLWVARECAAMGLEEVASAEWRVTSDNSQAFGRAAQLMERIG
jgi:hypothetical protein